MVFTIWIYLVCSFGNQVTDRLIEINDMMFGCAWYQYPIELRRSQLMMMSAQRPIYIEGFPNSKCTLDTFKEVNHAQSFLKCDLKDGFMIYISFLLFQVMKFCYSVFMLVQRTAI